MSTMTHTLAGHAAPAIGSEVPLEMLAACHLSVQDQCATLLRLVPHLAAHGPDRSAQEAATAVMRYFDISARQHHEDEERDLFPALIESMAGTEAVRLRDLTTSLAAEHRDLEAGWRSLRAVLAQVAAGQAAPLARDDVNRFTRRYARHIEREEAELLPMAQRLLSHAELDRIGLAMRTRRAVPRDTGKAPSNARLPDPSIRISKASTP